MGLSPAHWLAAEPFTLVLGAGFFGFFAHAGLIQALDHRGLRPRRVVGVSAGALAGGVWASGVPIDDLRTTLLQLRRQDFWDPGVPLGGLLKGAKFSRRLCELLGDVVQVGDTQIPFASVAHDVLGRRTVVMDTGPLEVAIRASCAVPLMFRPVRHQGRWLVDGGVSDRPGLTALATGERALLHHLPSRSPWRSLYNGTEADPPAVRSRLKLVIPDLPRVSPGRLDRGPAAFEAALAFAGSWLDTPDRS